MRAYLALSVAALALTGMPALADSTTYNFSLTDETAGYGPVTFSLDSSLAQSDGFTSYDFSNVSASEAGSPATLTVEITPTSSGDILELYDFGYNLSLYAEFSPKFATGDPTSEPLVLNAATSTGYNSYNCDAKLQMPLVRSELPLTMAFLQVQSPIVIQCSDLLSLDVSQAASTTPPPPTTGVTPEPATLSLLGTGVLGLAGMVQRRRLRA